MLVSPQSVWMHKSVDMECALLCRHSEEIEKKVLELRKSLLKEGDSGKEPL